MTSAEIQDVNPLPPLVRRALELAEQLRFGQSCALETGRLLAVLAGQIRGGVIAEIGSGCGVGTAWMATTLRPPARLVTVELDGQRAAAVERLMRNRPAVHVLQGDWHQILDAGPFAMLFADGGRAKEREPETLLRSLEPGGLVVLDDLTPEELWPEEWRGKPDPVRQFWLHDARLAATEIAVSSIERAILAVRLH